MSKEIYSDSSYELVHLRTENSKSFIINGKLVTRFYNHNVHYRVNEHEYYDIDNSLVHDNGIYRTDKSGYNVGINPDFFELIISNLDCKLVISDDT